MLVVKPTQRKKEKKKKRGTMTLKALYGVRVGEQTEGVGGLIAVVF